MLTWFGVGAYKALTNEGGGAASDQRARFYFLKIAFGHWFRAEAMSFGGTVLVS